MWYHNADTLAELAVDQGGSLMSLIKYKGYAAKVDYSVEDKLLIGAVIGIKDSLHFHAENSGEVETAFHSTIDDYLEVCRQRGLEPSKPFSGEFRYRPGKKRHEDLSRLAAQENASNNDLVNRAVDEYLKKKEVAA